MIIEGDSKPNYEVEIPFIHFLPALTLKPNLGLGIGSPIPGINHAFILFQKHAIVLFMGLHLPHLIPPLHA